MEQHAQEMTVRIAFDNDTTAREADEHTRSLLRALERLDIERVDMVEGEPEAGTRGDPLSALAFGAIALSGLSVRALLPHIVAVVQSWLRASEQRSVTLEVDGVKLQVNGQTTTPEKLDAYLATLHRQGLLPGDAGGGGDQ